MVKKKTWTAADIAKTGQITITEVSPGKIRFYQPYHFLDEAGGRIDELKETKTLVDVEWLEIPDPIRSSIQAIREYLYNMAITANGMNEV